MKLFRQIRYDASGAVAVEFALWTVGLFLLVAAALRKDEGCRTMRGRTKQERTTVAAALRKDEGDTPVYMTE